MPVLTHPMASFIRSCSVGPFAGQSAAGAGSAFSSAARTSCAGGTCVCALAASSRAARSSGNSIVKVLTSQTCHSAGGAQRAIFFHKPARLCRFQSAPDVGRSIPVCVFLLAALLILRGMSLGIPYLSPDMSGSGPSCCHK